MWTVGNRAGSGDFRKISAYAGMNRWPLWAPDGQGLYFVSDRDGMENLWFQPLEGAPAHRLTDFGEGRLLWPSISRAGRTIVFERDFGIWRMDVGSGAIAPLVIRVRPDTKFTPVRVATYSRDLTELELSPDGKKVAFVARGEIFADFADKETDKDQRQGPSFRVTNTPFRESDVTWSPDSRKLIYTSDRHGVLITDGHRQYERGSLCGSREDEAGRGRESMVTTLSRNAEAPGVAPAPVRGCQGRRWVRGASRGRRDRPARRSAAAMP